MAWVGPELGTLAVSYNQVGIETIQIHKKVSWTFSIVSNASQQAQNRKMIAGLFQMVGLV